MDERSERVYYKYDLWSPHLDRTDYALAFDRDANDTKSR